ncbi:charged multivesicular body protein 4b-like [Oscarella lobularis]|uniref:charged multivesicular body protein 4b-like n=1 Tax=Oscarella lobularis TaxID=121494 RepID=UPI0033136280
MHRLFGGKKKKEAPAPTAQDAIQRLKTTEEMLEKKTEFLEAKIKGELQNAKKHGTKNKRAALMALKRKKRYEKQLQQIDGTLSTIEFQREALENANTNAEVLKNMHVASQALKSAHKTLDVDDVHDLMDDISEQNELAQEISEALTQGVGAAQDIDEDDLMAELEELEQEQIDEQMLNIQSSDLELPEVPEAAPAAAAVAPTRAKAKSAEDKELEELEAWATA